MPACLPACLPGISAMPGLLWRQAGHRLPVCRVPVPSPCVCATGTLPPAPAFPCRRFWIMPLIRVALHMSPAIRQLGVSAAVHVLQGGPTNSTHAWM